MNVQTRKTFRTGLFEDKASADAAYEAALRHGYHPDEINVLMSEDTKKKYYATNVHVERGDQSIEGLAIGGVVGGSVLGAIGAIVALSSTIAFPGLGLVIAGPLAGALAGVGAGSVAGGLLGALIGAGIPEEHARIYEQGIKKGGIVLAVPSTDKDEELLTDWKKTEGKDFL